MFVLLELVLTCVLFCLQLEDACKVECLKEWHQYQVSSKAQASQRCSIADQDG
jgi:hypothetical protein